MVLVTGANGQLGNEMRIVSKNSAHRYVFTDVVEMPGVDTVKLDITDLEAVKAAVADYYKKNNIPFDAKLLECTEEGCCHLAAHAEH